MSMSNTRPTLQPTPRVKRADRPRPAAMVGALFAAFGLIAQLTYAQTQSGRRMTTQQQQQLLNSGQNRAGQPSNPAPGNQPVAPANSGPATPAPPPPPPPPGAGIGTTNNNNAPRFRAEMTNNRLTVTDLSNNRRVFGNVIHPIVRDTPAQATVRMTPVADGADLSVELRNTTNRPIALGSIAFGGLQMAANLTYVRFRHDVEEQTLVNHADMAIGQWPNDLYSPVQVVRDSNYIVGLQLMHDAIGYNHPVRVITIGENWQGRGHPQWTMAFELLGQLAPGQTRTYNVALRVTRPDQNFLNTLVPYRDFFQRTYGQVRYTRDPRPVMGLPIAFTEFSNASNPRGFAGSTFRPDQNGWGPWVNRVQDYLRRTNFKRAVMWCPSGVYANNNVNNFPFKFMTGINDLPRAAATFDQFRSLSANGVDFGFWWGHSTWIHRQWDPRTREELDPNNPDHVRLANAELDMAVRAGAKLIGLDAYTISKPGDAFRWLEMMQRRAPGVRFVTEQSASDLLHVLAPTFTEQHLVQGPHVLADFLVPGHETWVAITTWPTAPGQRSATQADRDRELNRITGFGYVPVHYGPIDFSNNLAAAESWNTTVPPPLQASAPAAARYRSQVAGVTPP